MGRPVALVVVGVLATVATLVRLRSDVHVHDVLIHQRLVHETLLAILTLEARLVVADMLISHVDGQAFHLCSAYATRFPGVNFFLVFIQLVLVRLHLTTVRTLNRFCVMIALKVTSQMLRSLPLEAAMVTYLLVRLHMPLQLQLRLKAVLATSFRAGQPPHVNHLHVSLLLGVSDCSRLAKTIQLRQSEGAWQVRAVTGEVLDGVDQLVPLHILCQNISSAVWTESGSTAGIFVPVFDSLFPVLYFSFLLVKSILVIIHGALAGANITTFITHKTLVPGSLVFFQRISGLESFWTLFAAMPAHVDNQQVLFHLLEIQVLFCL